MLLLSACLVFPSHHFPAAAHSSTIQYSNIYCNSVTQARSETSAAQIGEHLPNPDALASQYFKLILIFSYNNQAERLNCTTASKPGGKEILRKGFFSLCQQITVKYTQDLLHISDKSQKLFVFQFHGKGSKVSKHRHVTVRHLTHFITQEINLC